MALKDLRALPATVQLGSTSVQVWGLSIDAILALLERQPGLVAAYQAQDSGARVQAIANVLRNSGPATIADVIDAATRSEPGTAAALVASGDMTAIDQVELLAAAIRQTLPEDRVGKLAVQFVQYADVLDVKARA